VRFEYFPVIFMDVEGDVRGGGFVPFDVEAAEVGAPVVGVVDTVSVSAVLCSSVGHAAGGEFVELVGEA